MSSSRRSSPIEPTQKAGHCPTCGSHRVITTEEDVVLRVRGRSHRVPSVTHEHCLACGERIFDLEASRRFDGIVLKGRGRRAA